MCPIHSEFKIFGMSKTFKTLVLVLILSPILMAFQCDNDQEDRFEFNDYSIGITAKDSFSQSEIIWIEGKVSSNAYNLSIQDSVFSELNNGNVFSVYKFISPTEHFNSKDAIDQFEIIFDIGTASFLPSCENAQMTIHTVLDRNNLFYSYRIGLKPKFKGDYVISFQDSKLRNTNKNIEISYKYPIERHPNQIGFNRCGLGSWLEISESTNEYFFTVE